MTGRAREDCTAKCEFSYSISDWKSAHAEVCLWWSIKSLHFQFYTNYRVVLSWS